MGSTLSKPSERPLRGADDTRADSDLTPRITTLRPKRIVGLHATMTFGDPAVRDLWQRLRREIGGMGNRVGESFIALRIFDPPPTDAPRMGSRFVQWAAVEVTDFDDVPTSLRTHTMAGGLYAVLAHRGTAASFRQTAEILYGRWLPESPYELAPREFFEVLGPGYRPDDPEATEDIWIPIRPRS